MDWNAAMEDNRQMLKRIVALLYAFAGLAERMCDLPRPGLVLWVLRSAETIARDFVMDTALEHGMSAAPDLFITPALHSGNSAADAMRLARSFRVFAVMLDRLTEGNPGRRRIGITRMCLALAACAARFRLPAGTTVERRQSCLTPPGFAIERRDSS